MVLRLAIALGVLALAGCTRADSPPTTPLADSTLVQALIESHIASARSGRTGEPVDSLRTAAYASLGIDSADVMEAVDIYSRHPQAFVRLYDRVLDQLVEEQMRHDLRISPEQEDAVVLDEKAADRLHDLEIEVHEL